MTIRLIGLTVNGRALRVMEGATVAAALIDAQQFAFRDARTGSTRGPLCGMGMCQECRVMIDDVAHQRACMVVARDGMRVRTAIVRP
jgi:aerobic-type carbon monoxide dehydrogenase small subunit (CoxS/CutS family)